MAELAFFVGKGGVGKTTVSAAYAVHQASASRGQRVLLISTDPAHSLADVLELRLGDKPEKIPLRSGGQLRAWQVSPEKRFGTFLAKYKQDLLATIEQGTMFTRPEIEPLLDTTLPGMAEMASLLAIDDALQSGEYDQIVVDTAPFGHTLRLFELPDHFSRLLDFIDLAASRDVVLAAHFGGTAPAAPRFIEQWRRMVDGIQLAVKRNAKMFLVTTPEKFALNESLRCAEALRRSELKITAVVVNRAVRQNSACATCKRKAEATRAAFKFLKKEFASTEIFVGEDGGSPVLGAANLRGFAEHVFKRKPLRLRSVPPRAPAIKLEAISWPVLNQQLALVVGKGGVGKTTISAALAFHARQMQPEPVAICSVDPAPSLDDIFQQSVGDTPAPVLGDEGLQASELDAAAEFAKWVAGVRGKIDQALSAGTSGVGVDLSFERRLFSALLDVVPPGVDEIFAVFRILDLLASRGRHVIIDMAPTGHALELLRMPERMLIWSRLLLKTLAAHRTLALARDVAVQVAQAGQRVRELRDWLKDAARAQLWTVMLAEPLPDRETERLAGELSRLGLGTGPLVINRVLFAEDVGNCGHCAQARRWQLATISKVRRQHRGRDVFVMRNFPSEIAGKKQLQAFTRKLWRLS